MRLVVSNIRNSTWHEAEMTVTVSFMRGVSGTGIVQGAYGDGTDGFDANGNPAGKRYFELTRKPTYVADESVDELGYPSADITKQAAWSNTTPARVLGLASASIRGRAAPPSLLPDSVNLDAQAAADGTLRPGVKIEYYVPDWNRSDTAATAGLDDRESVVPETALADAAGPVAAAAGEWVSYEALAARYTVGDVTTGGTVTPRGPHGQRQRVPRRHRRAHHLLRHPGHRRRPHRLPAGRRVASGRGPLPGHPPGRHRREPRRGRAGTCWTPRSRWTSPSPIPTAS